ncbi:MAG: acetyltransferase [Syntrophobacteraceae bacterium]
MSKVVIFGTATFAEVVHVYLNHDSEHEVVAFTVHKDHMEQNKFRDLPVVPFENIESKYSPELYSMFVAVGARKVNRIRADIYTCAKKKGYQLISYVNSKVSYLQDIKIGDNCFIFEDNTIQPFVTIGNNVVLWSGNHIGHHSSIGDHTFITSHVVVSGHVNIGPYCFIGVNATFRDNITIGNSCVIGAGALIMKSTRDREVYIGQRTLPDPRSSDQLDF